MILVTGITGHSGKWFVRRLINENYLGKIRCIVRIDSDTSIIDKSGLNIEKIYADLKNDKIIESAMSGVKYLIHIASISYSEKLINIAIIKKVEWAILVHTTGKYSRYKSAAEEYNRIEDKILKKRSKIGITILRPTMIYGSSRDRNMYKLIDYLYNHKFFPIFGNGNNLMQPVHAKDLGNAYFDVLVNKKKTFNKEYNLSGKNPIRYIDLVRLISKNINKKNVIIKVPFFISLAGAKIYNLLSTNAQISVEQVYRMQEDKDFTYDNAKIDFGYSPISFKDGIKEEVLEYMNSNREG
jgi:nucleoside-diphosphate-sugar epimerase